MSAPLDCPELECWQALFEDAVPPDQQDHYEQHLEDCFACQERLRRADGHGDGLLTLMPSAEAVSEPESVATIAPTAAPQRCFSDLGDA